MIPFGGLLAAIYGCWGWGVSWIDLVLLLTMYLGTGLGITIGFHRLFTHRSFETIAPIRIALAILGSMAVEGPVLNWVATHREHHQHSDQERDPHSPRHFGSGTWGLIRGWWHAHIGWMFSPHVPDCEKYARDLRQDAAIGAISRLFPVWVALGLAIPAVIGGIVTASWTGAALGFLWGGLVRIFFVHHITWSINSVCHLWGARPYQTRDDSRNNVVCGVLAFGEGWHNNHHAFPTSARHGLRWWQFDLSYLLIRGLALVGLAWRVRLPTQERIQRRSRAGRRVAKRIATEESASMARPPVESVEAKTVQR